MRVGIPKGLLYYKYYPFMERFFTELGADIIVSPDTNKEILDKGVKYCVDEACLPVKVFHGHVAHLKDECDVIVVPRIMQLRHREFICPKFCGLPEMVSNSISSMPVITMEPIYATSERDLYNSVKAVGKLVTNKVSVIDKAYEKALEEQRAFKTGINDEGYKFKVVLAGHPYNIYDNFTNMNLIKKLNNLGVGVITEEFVDDNAINQEVNKLFKRPFWSFARNSYGASSYLVENSKVNGIVYISSFACGIDSVVIELIKDRIGEFPMLILKIDEHTGEAGLDTRIEAFVDMLERRD